MLFIKLSNKYYTKVLKYVAKRLVFFLFLGKGKGDERSMNASNVVEDVMSDLVNVDAPESSRPLST